MCMLYQRNRVRVAALVRKESNPATPALLDSQATDTADDELSKLIQDLEVEQYEDTECSTSSGESFLQCIPGKTDSTITEKQKEKTSSQRKRRVRFGTVTIRDYDMILGDHPCCSCGPPVTIDWTYRQNEPVDVDVYQFETVLSRKSLRRCRTLNYYQRKHLLSDYTELDLKAAIQEIKRINSNRKISMHFGTYHAVQAALGSAYRKLKRTTK
ncbi:hypothetical protein ACHAXR_002118 [Thalassiosira sp. AJA248-18]